MKYFIKINQLALRKIDKRLDIKDAAILDYIIGFCSADDKRISQMDIKEDGENYRYTWINFGHLIKEMPILKFKQTASITQRMKKLKMARLIKTHNFSPIGKGQKTYVRLTERVKELFFTTNKTKLIKIKNQTNLDLKPKKSKLMKHNINEHNINEQPFIEASASMGKQVNDLIDLFKEVNPSHQRLFGMKSQRDAMERLLKKFSYEQIEKMINTLSQIIDKPYAPQITTPYQLEQKLGNLIAYLKREKVKRKKGGVIII